MATAIEDFRQVSRAEVEPGTTRTAQFYRLTPGKKMIVMLGGPSMNLLIFLVLFTVLLTTLGMPHDDATTTVGERREASRLRRPDPRRSRTSARPSRSPRPRTASCGPRPHRLGRRHRDHQLEPARRASSSRPPASR